VHQGNQGPKRLRHIALYVAKCNSGTGAARNAGEQRNQELLATRCCLANGYVAVSSLAADNFSDWHTKCCKKGTVSAKHSP